MLLKINRSSAVVKSKSAKFTAVKMGSAFKFTLSVTSSDESMGTTSGSGIYTKGASILIAAHPNTGFIFSHWSDGSTEMSRMIIVKSDISLVAYFEVLPDHGILRYNPCNTRIDWSKIGALKYNANNNYVDWSKMLNGN